eukprot:scaffold23095_cov35-Tisochrysis_lutea.AAC.1
MDQTSQATLTTSTCWLAAWSQRGSTQRANGPLARRDSHLTSAESAPATCAAATKTPPACECPRSVRSAEHTAQVIATPNKSMSTWMVAPAWAGSNPARCSTSGRQAPATMEHMTIAASEAEMATASARGYWKSSTRTKPTLTNTNASLTDILASSHR